VTAAETFGQREVFDGFCRTVDRAPVIEQRCLRELLARSRAVTVIVSAALGCIANFAATALHADDGSVETVGGAVRLMRAHANIRMVSETVKARISFAADSLLANRTEMIEVDCVFVMKNEGTADTVLMGFPDGAMGPYQGGGEEHELESFRSWVDGVEVKCTRVPNVTDAPPSEVGSWWIKSVVFAPGATRTIRNRYTVLPGWYPTMATRAFRYTLSTGASWKGNIGSAEIVAVLDGIPLDWVTGTDPKARQVGNTFHWLLRDFEPGSADGSPAELRLEWRSPDQYLAEPDSLEN
jgi:hypothetical protein